RTAGIGRWADRIGDLEEILPARRPVVGEEALDLGAELWVAGTGLGQEGLSFGGRAAQGGGEEGADVLPALRSHATSPPSWPRSQARATRQSPSTVAAETPSTSATSGTESPVKNRSATTRPWR